MQARLRNVFLHVVFLAGRVARDIASHTPNTSALNNKPVQANFLNTRQQLKEGAKDTSFLGAISWLKEAFVGEHNTSRSQVPPCPRQTMGTVSCNCSPCDSMLSPRSSAFAVPVHKLWCSATCPRGVVFDTARLFWWTKFGSHHSRVVGVMFGRPTFGRNRIFCLLWWPTFRAHRGTYVRVMFGRSTSGRNRASQNRKKVLPFLGKLCLVAAECFGCHLLRQNTMVRSWCASGGSKSRDCCNSPC